MEVRFHQRERSRRNLRQNIHWREGCRISQQRKLKYVLDRARGEFQPDSIVFTSNIVVCWVWGPFDSQMSEIVEPDSDSVATLSHCGVQIDVQTRDESTFHRICGAT